MDWYRPFKWGKRALISGLTLGMLVLGGGATAKAIDKQLEEEPPKSRVSAGLNYSELILEERVYEQGISLDIDADIDVELLDWLSLNPELHYNQQWMEMTEKDGSDSITNLEASLEVVGRSTDSDDAYVYLALGGEFTYYLEEMTIRGMEGFEERYDVGPKLTLGAELPKFAVHLAGSAQWGGEDSSYFREMDNFLAHGELSFTGRAWEMELTATLDLYYWVITEEKKVDKENFLINSEIKLCGNVTGEVSICGNFNWTEYIAGEEDYQVNLFGIEGEYKF